MSKKGALASIGSLFLFGSFPALALFLAAAFLLAVMAYAGALLWILVAVICLTALVHFGHERIAGFGGEVQKLYHNDSNRVASDRQRYLANACLIAVVLGVWVGYLAFGFTLGLAWIVGFALTDYPITHRWHFRYREDARYNYRPTGSSPGHATAGPLFGIGLVGTWLLLFVGDASSWEFWIWFAGAVIGPVAHGVGFWFAGFEKKDRFA